MTRASDSAPMGDYAVLDTVFLRVRKLARQASAILIGVVVLDASVKVLGSHAFASEHPAVVGEMAFPKGIEVIDRAPIDEISFAFADGRELLGSEGAVGTIDSKADVCRREQVNKFC
jgi:hypothetical protein